MNSDAVTRGLLFLSLTATGVPGNTAVIRCLLEVLATFEIYNVFDDTGCKAVIFVYRTSRSLSNIILYVTLEHKTSHNGQFLEIEIYASSES